MHNAKIASVKTCMKCMANYKDVLNGVQNIKGNARQFFEGTFKKVRMII